MTKDEALKLSLEAITQYLAECPDPSEEAVEGLCDAASAAREALAQPEQPTPKWQGARFDSALHDQPSQPELYDQTALELCNVCGWKTLIPDDACLNCERAQPEQEPVAWVEQIMSAFPLFDDKGLDEEKHHCEWTLQQDRKRLHTMLKTTPPQRTWVGLTDDEIWKDDAIMSANSGYGATFDTLRDIVRAVEAKLKEKNNG